MLIVSSDLIAMKRFCTAESLDNVVPVSMMRTRNFAKDYGVLLVDGPLSGITTRAVVTISKDNKVLHSELVSEIVMNQTTKLRWILFQIINVITKKIIVSMILGIIFGVLIN